MAVKLAPPRSGIRLPLGLLAAVALVSLTVVSSPALGHSLSPVHQIALPPKVKPEAPGAGAFANARPIEARMSVRVKGATRLGFCGGDDWEPEIATDSARNYVYVVWTHFVGNPACDSASANPNRVYIQVSNDGGKTFGPPHEVADTVNHVNYPNQIDNVVAVDPVTGAVYVSFLIYGLADNKGDVAVAASTDHGDTFTATKINRGCDDCDHPWTISTGGQAYVAYAQDGRHFISHSPDGGLTWKESVALKADSVAFPEGAVVDGAGNAYFAWADCRHAFCQGKISGDYRVSKTLAGTLSTTFVLVARAPAGPKCPYDPNCGFAYFSIQDDIAIDAAGRLYLVWQDGQNHKRAGSPPIVQLSRSTDRGATWSYVGRADDKAASRCAASACYALFPRVEGGAPGQVAVMWMDDRNGSPLNHKNGWTVRLRTSTTGGDTWEGRSTRVSTYDPSRPESQRRGFRFPYGDYEGISLLSDEDTTRAVMIWGEGFNWVGGPDVPGHVVYRSIVLWD